ncbi:unnamed protein product, partial [Pylaiella littoralis]
MDIGDGGGDGIDSEIDSGSGIGGGCDNGSSEGGETDLEEAFSDAALSDGGYDSSRDESDGGGRVTTHAGGMTVSGRDYATRLCTAFSPATTLEFPENIRIATEIIKKRKGKAPSATKADLRIGSVPAIVKVLSGLRDARKGDLLIRKGASFKRSHVETLLPDYDIAYMFDSASFDVVLGTTRVSRPGKKKVKVVKFDHGKYILGDKTKTQITQSELLKTRCGEGMTLDQDLRRYILKLVTMYIVMKKDVVPYFLSPNSGVDKVGLLWNVNEALEAATENGGIDPVSKMTTAELEAKKVRLDRVQTLSIEIFTKCSAEECLP